MKLRLADGSGTIDLKYLVEETVRSGAVRIRFRRGSHKVTLTAPPGSDAFLAQYRAALTGAEAPAEPDRNAHVTKVRAQTLRWLCAKYFTESDDYTLPPPTGLDDRTRRVRRQILEAICQEPVVRGEPDAIGDQPVADFTAEVIEKIRNRKGKTPESANGRVKALRRLFAWGVAKKHARYNAARDVAYIKTASAGHHTWTVEEVRRFEQHHPVGTRARLALALLLYIGGRRADIPSLGRQHIRKAENMPADLQAVHSGSWLRYTQHKNRKRKPVTLEIPLLAELEEIIAASPCGDLTFLVTEFAKPFTTSGFGNWFGDRCREAGVPGRAHGLRKAGASIAAENGASERQLMAIYGWSTSKEAVRYTRGAEQRRLAGGAMRLLSTRRSGAE